MSEQSKNQELALLLSAYLDGEVTTAQRHKLEQRLSRDPQARRLLDELRQVSELVGQLPRERAPAELSESIRQQLERESLIGQGDGPHESIGRKRLHLRRLAAAAAIIVLGAAAALVYKQTLARPEALEPPEQPRATKLAQSDEHVPDGMRLRREEAEKVALSGTVPERRPATQRPPSLDRAAADLRAAPAYNTVCLVVESRRMSADTREIEYLFEQSDIRHVVRRYVGPHRRRYAFLCSLGQFGAFFRHVARHCGNNVDLVVTVPATNRQIVVPAITEAQAMRLAQAPGLTSQLLLARRFSSENQPEQSIIAGAAATVVAGVQKLATGLVPTQGELPNLRSLAPAAPNSPCPPCPREILAANAAAAQPKSASAKAGVTSQNGMINSFGRIESTDTQQGAAVAAGGVQLVAVLLELKQLTAASPTANAAATSAPDNRAAAAASGRGPDPNAAAVPAPMK